MAKPSPPRLSEHQGSLEALEASGVYSNYGPEARRLESALANEMFEGGHCLAVCNATIGLMLAIQQVLWRRKRKRRYALMPSYTFAATAHAAIWNGLTPLFCDVDQRTWNPSAKSEEDLLRQYEGEIAVVVPCTTFGNPIPMERYDRFHKIYDVDIVVDAAAALGSRDKSDQHFGRASQWPIVFSMHATKPFATGEGGIIYCADFDRIEELRAMASFGFEVPRTTSLPGLNAKISEVAALTGYLQLKRFQELVTHRAGLKSQYQRHLPGLSRQQKDGSVQVHSYEFVLLPEVVAHKRDEIVQDLREKGIGTGCYFSPHLAQQPYFSSQSPASSLPLTESLSRRVLTLPMFDSMEVEDIKHVSHQLQMAIRKHSPRRVSVSALDGIMPEFNTPVVTAR